MVGLCCCCCSVTQSCPTLCNPWPAVCQASLSLTISRSLPKFMFTASVILSSRLTLWHPVLLLPPIFPSIRDFSNESALHTRCPRYQSFSLSISPSSEYSGLIALSIDWFDLLAVQGTFRSLPQHHSSKASIPWHSAVHGVAKSWTQLGDWTKTTITETKTILFIWGLFILLF